VADGDRELLREVLAIVRDVARFRQPRPPTKKVAAAAAPDTSLLSNIFGSSEKSNKRKRDSDSDDSDDSNDAAAATQPDAASSIYDDSIDYVISPDAQAAYYIVNILLPRDTVLTADRLGLLCSLSPAHILPNFLDWGIDFETGRPFLNVRVNKHANTMFFESRLVIIEHLGSGPAMRTTTGGGLPLADGGVTVHRTQEGVVINGIGSGRTTKRARHY
jgi:hypothetical protein